MNSCSSAASVGSGTAEVDATSFLRELSPVRQMFYSTVFSQFLTWTIPILIKVRQIQYTREHLCTFDMTTP